jgi:ferredoxin
MSEQMVRVIIEGRTFTAPASKSILQAYVHSGEPLLKNVGCMGQGVCGSCRCMVRRAGSSEVATELACETPIEEGMQVSFIDHLTPRRRHVYQIEDVCDSWKVYRQIDEIFPEAKHCRHCSGCDRACPKDIEVERGVTLAVAGDIYRASEIFELCVMCDLCTMACPEHIRPNHLGMFVRRAVASLSLRPSDLVTRLQQIESGEMTVDVNAPAGNPLS